MNPVRVFGFNHPHLERKPVPVGLICPHCKQSVADWDVGFILDLYSEEGVGDVAYHRNCFLECIGVQEEEP